VLESGHTMEKRAMENRATGNRATEYRASENRDVLPGFGSIIRDRHLQVVLVATACVGFFLSAFLPQGHTRSLLSDPLLWIGFLLVHPLLEEWIFRGIIQGEYLRRSRARWKTNRIGLPDVGLSHANLATTLLFCLAHFLAEPGLWAVAVAVPSLVLGHFRERFGGLSVPVALHGLFNAVYLVSGIG
jgi:membrane protease YdiL (CAAX protease family)